MKRSAQLVVSCFVCGDPTRVTEVDTSSLFGSTYSSYALKIRIDHRIIRYGVFEHTMGSASHSPYGSGRPRFFRRCQLGLPVLSERSKPCRSSLRVRGLGMRHEKTLYQIPQHRQTYLKSHIVLTHRKEIYNPHAHNCPTTSDMHPILFAQNSWMRKEVKEKQNIEK